MAGNVYDWTAESHSSDYRVLRGYYCDTYFNYLYAGLRGDGGSDGFDERCGTRLALYIIKSK